MVHLNEVILTGRLTADPELKTTPSGVAVMNCHLDNRPREEA